MELQSLTAPVLRQTMDLISKPANLALLTWTSMSMQQPPAQPLKMLGQALRRLDPSLQHPQKVRSAVKAGVPAFNDSPFSPTRICQP